MGLLSLALVVFGLLPPAPAPAAAVDAKFDEDAADQLLVPVAINGNSFWCGVDSGGGALVAFDEASGRRAGFKASTTGVSAGVGASYVADERVHDVSLSIGGVKFFGVTVVMRPFSAELTGIDCFIGLGVLQPYVVEFDYAAPRLRLFTPEDFVPPAGADPVAIEIQRNSPFAAATLHLAGDREPDQMKLLVDTGASSYSAMLFPGFVSGHALVARAAATAPPPEMPRGVGGGVGIVATRAARLTVGSYDQQGALVGLVTTESGGSRLPADGLLGARFLRGFTVTFDFGRRQMFLQPNRQSTEPPPFDASGVAFRRDAASRRFVVARVLAPSPAASAGLERGDELVTIDGRSAETLTAAELKELLSRPGARRALQVRSRDQTRSVDLLLSDPLVR